LLAVALLLAALAVALLLATALLLAVPLAALLLAALAVALLLATALLLAVPLAALLLAALAVALLLATALLLAVALPARGVESGLLVGVAPPARLITGEPWLLLGVEMLLVAPALQLLGVDPKLVEQTGVLLGVDLAHALQLLGGLLVVTPELTDKVHDRRGVEVHVTPFCCCCIHSTCARAGIGLPHLSLSALSPGGASTIPTAAAWRRRPRFQPPAAVSGSDPARPARLRFPEHHLHSPAADPATDVTER